jgi:uncharacterized protein (TIGR00730 family)
MTDGQHSDSHARDTWRLFRYLSEFVESFDLLGEIGPAVTMFGSARLKPTNQFYKLARQTAGLMSKAGYTVITGGGPGIMEAANRGAVEAGGQSVGLNISLPAEQVANRYQTLSMNFHYFFARKVTFIKYATAIVCFPGGFGTMDEFFESMTLMQTLKVERYPLILMGTAFWEGLLGWVREKMLDTYHSISAEDMDLFTLTDDPMEAVAIVQDYCQAKERAEAEAATISIPYAEQLTAEGTRQGMPVSIPPLGKRRR